MRVVRAFRLPIIAAMTALALSGCVHTTAPVAMAQPQNDLDSLAYGEPYNPAVASPSDVADSGGAISALRNSFAASFAAAPQRGYAPYPAAAYAAAPMPAVSNTAYRLDAGDKLRVVVFGQEGLTNTYAIDAGGSITMPLIGSVPARGRTPAGLAAEITAKLRGGFIRDPSVAVEIEAYRPFFILGEVAAPGQYPYVPNMSVESAVAIAGGFSPRARRDSVTLTHTDNSGPMRIVVPLGTALSPGDTVLVGERWF
ncbi:MAG: Polysaccharide export outer membrane protein [Bradyrhizobium sp.]|nr:Polysaccharide export outer membrane protein [Bradyrhizobium sp.]